MLMLNLNSPARRRAHFWAVTVGIAMLVVHQARTGEPAEAQPSLHEPGKQIFLFGHADAMRLLHHSGYTNTVVTRIYRDSGGTKLFIQFRLLPRSERDSWTAIVSSNGVKVVTCPAAGIFNDREELAYWRDDRAYYFGTNTGLTTMPAPLYILSDPSRECL